MKKYYSVKIKRTNEDDRTVTEQYIVEAVSVTDAEVVIVKHLQGYHFEVKAVTETKIVDVVLND
jgi:hypothetical protein